MWSSLSKSLTKAPRDWEYILSYLLLLFCAAERLERIPWIAPECVDNGTSTGNTSDQWSFGATLLEICNNGNLSMSGSTLSEVAYLFVFQQPQAAPACFILPTSNCNSGTFVPNRKSAFISKRAVYQNHPRRNWPASSACVWPMSLWRGLRFALCSESSQKSWSKVGF